MTKKTKSLGKDRVRSETFLLDAARHVFAEQGFSAATTRAIAERAGVNVALIARYFRNKDGLFTAVIERDLRANLNQDLSYPICKNFHDECIAFVKDRFKRRTSQTEYFRTVMGQFVTDRKLVKTFQDASLLQCDTSAFEARLNMHLQKLHLKKVKTITLFAERIDMNVTAAILFEIIISGNSLKSTLKKLTSFVSEYSAMFLEHHKT